MTSEQRIAGWMRQLRFWFTQPAAYHCKPMGSKHMWRGPLWAEKFPVCVKCGKPCWWLKGYTTNLGTYLAPDNEALFVACMSNLNDIPWDSRP